MISRRPTPQILSALVPLERMLEADGYAMSIDEDSAQTRITITVSPSGGACAECLVTADVLALMVAKALGSVGVTRQIDLVMPDAGHAS